MLLETARKSNFGVKVPHVRRLLCVLLATSLSAYSRPPSPAQRAPIIDVQKPTVIAFFPHVTDAELAKDPDTNEALADFQLYATEARQPLKELGVELRQVYARSFRVRVGTSLTTVRPEETVGYYFVAPGKKARIEYGVMTNTDLLDAARGYFDTAKK